MPNCGGTGLRETLRRNLGKVVTIFPEAGGRAGSGFTGVLSEADENTVRLISLHDRGRDGHRCCRCEDEHRIQTIPINKIVCVTTQI